MPPGRLRMFLPVSESVRASRLRLAALHRSARPRTLIDDADRHRLGGLATNAIRHARSPFRVSVVDRWAAWYASRVKDRRARATPTCRDRRRRPGDRWPGHGDHSMRRRSLGAQRPRRTARSSGPTGREYRPLTLGTACSGAVRVSADPEPPATEPVAVVPRARARGRARRGRTRRPRRRGRRARATTRPSTRRAIESMNRASPGSSPSRKNVVWAPSRPALSSSRTAYAMVSGCGG